MSIPDIDTENRALFVKLDNEIDLAIGINKGNLMLKTKLFNSKLDEFIHYNASKNVGLGTPQGGFDNVDATIYGLDIIGFYDFVLKQSMLAAAVSEGTARISHRNAGASGWLNDNHYQRPAPETPQTTSCKLQV